MTSRQPAHRPFHSAEGTPPRAVAAPSPRPASRLPPAAPARQCANFPNFSVRAAGTIEAVGAEVGQALQPHAEVPAGAAG